MSNQNNSSTSSSKKKKIAAAAMAVALAATLLIGGTVSYLTATSETVVNNFNSPELEVDVNETTGDEYTIIPGTTEKKDPYVYVTSTLEYAYVYLFVVDETDGLVTYTIADGWTKLYSDDDTSNPYAGTNITVYYRVASEGTSAFQVLSNDTVSYDKDITYDDLYDEDGNLRDDIKLSFYSIAVQCDGFTDAKSALSATVSTVDDENDLTTAASSGGIIVLASDIEVSKTVSISTDTVIYGSGYTLSSSSSSVVTVSDGVTLTYSGGTIASTNTSGSYSAVDNEGGTVTLENVTVTNTSHYAIVNHGTMTLENCDVSSESTTSSMIENGWQNPSQNTDSEDSVMIINGGSYTASYYVVKNDDYGVMTINDGTFTNTGSGGTVLNWNELTINGGTFTSNDGYAIYNRTNYSSTSNEYSYEKGQLTINSGSFTSGGSGYYLMYNYGHGSVTITDGTFTSASGAIGYKGGDATYSISGGTYSSNKLLNNSSDNNSSALASGYSLTENSDGTYTVASTTSDSTESE